MKYSWTQHPIFPILLKLLMFPYLSPKLFSIPLLLFLKFTTYIGIPKHYFCLFFLNFIKIHCMYSSMASYVTFPEFSFIIFTALQESTGRTNFIHPFYYKWTCGFPIFCVHQQYCYEYSRTCPWCKCAGFSREELLNVCATHSWNRCRYERRVEQSS